MASVVVHSFEKLPQSLGTRKTENICPYGLMHKGSISALDKDTPHKETNNCTEISSSRRIRSSSAPSRFAPSNSHLPNHHSHFIVAFLKTSLEQLFALEHTKNRTNRLGTVPPYLKLSQDLFKKERERG